MPALELAWILVQLVCAVASVIVSVVLVIDGVLRALGYKGLRL